MRFESRRARRWSPPGGAGFVLLLLAACSGGDRGAENATAGEETPTGAVEAVDDVGRTVRLTTPARRVISLLPATTETLITLGVGDRLVGRTDYDDHPSIARLPSVGGGLTPNVELLASLRPDLVIAWEEAGTARVRPRLESLGISVFSVTTQDTAGIYANIERFGSLLGVDEQADSLLLAMRSDLEAVRASVEGRPFPRVLYMVSLDPPMVAGPNLFIGEMIGLAGGSNIFPEIRAASPQVSMEEIVARRPDVVLIPAEADSATLLRRLAGTSGWRELIESGRTSFRVLPTDILHRPGPSVVAAARALREVLHPDVAEHQ